MSKVNIHNPNEQPYGSLNNDFPHSMKIDNTVWNSVSNYLYANLLIYANHKGIIQHSPIKSELSEKQYSEKMNKFIADLKKNNIKDNTRIVVYSSQLEFQKLNLFEKFNRLADIEFSNIIIESMRKAYNYLIYESKDNYVFQEFLLSTGDDNIIYFSNNPFFGVNEKGEGHNLVGSVLSEMRQGLMIKKNIQKKEHDVMVQEQIIKYNIVAYDLLSNLLFEQNKSIKEYRGKRPVEIIDKYFKKEGETIYQNLKNQNGDIENVKNNLNLDEEIKDIRSLSELSLNDKLKILGYNDSNLKIFLEDYYNNHYPLLVDIINSQNEPIKKFIANVLEKNYKNRIRFQQEESRNLLIISYFLLDLIKTKKPNSILDEKDLVTIYNSFYIQRKSDAEFEKFCKQILNDYENKTMKDSARLRINTALAEFDKNRKEEEESLEDDDDDDDYKYDDEDNENSSSSSSSLLDDENDEEMKQFERLKYDKIFDLEINLKQDNIMYDMSLKEKISILSKLLNPYSSNQNNVYEIFLNRYRNEQDNSIESVSIGVFGNQEIITNEYTSSKNFGKKPKPVEILAELNKYLKVESYHPVRIEHIIIKQLITDTVKGNIVIDSNHMLGLTKYNKIIINGTFFPSCYMYIITYMNHKFCGINVGLKQLDLNQIKINDLIENYDFDVIENKSEFMLTRGKPFEKSINDFMENDDFVDPGKADFILQNNLKKTYEVMNVLLLLKSCSVKFKNIELQKTLILTENNYIAYYDRNNLFLGKNNDGPNIMGLILMYLRNYLFSKRISLNTISIYEQLKSNLNENWIENVVKDMCTLVYKLKYFLNVPKINSSFIETILNNLYNFYRIEEVNVPPFPPLIKRIVETCYGMEFYQPESEIERIKKIQAELVVMGEGIRGIEKKFDPLEGTVDKKFGKILFYEPGQISEEYENNLKAIIKLEDELTVKKRESGLREEKIKIEKTTKTGEKITETVKKITYKQGLSKKEIEIYEKDIKSIENQIKNLAKKNRQIFDELINPSTKTADKHSIFEMKKNEFISRIDQLIKNKASESDIQNERNKMKTQLEELKTTLFGQNKNKVNEAQQLIYSKAVNIKREEIKNLEEKIKILKELHKNDIQLASVTYWKYLYNLAIFMVQHLKNDRNNLNVNFIEFGRAITNFENPNIPRNCEKFFGNDHEMNCIATALINILVGIQNIKTKMNQSSDLSEKDINLASNILADISIKKERQEREQGRIGKNKKNESETKSMDKSKSEAETKSESVFKEIIGKKDKNDENKDVLVVEFDTNFLGLEIGENEDEDKNDLDLTLDDNLLEYMREIEDENQLVVEEEYDENQQQVEEEYDENAENAAFSFRNNKAAKKNKETFGMRQHAKLTNLINILKNFTTNQKNGNLDALTKLFVDNVTKIKKAKLLSKNKLINIFVNLLE